MRAVYRALRPIVLASASPRRSELLGLAGFEFEIAPSGVAEDPALPGESPSAYAMRLAEEKARDIARDRPEAVVIGADTVVAARGAVLGKPAHEAEALEMLETLSGAVHRVVTGCAILADGRAEVFAAETEVEMVASPREVLRAYVASGEPMDKAGAYAIQGLGAQLVRRVSGSYTNVVGLPLVEVLEALAMWGVIEPQ